MSESSVGSQDESSTAESTDPDEMFDELEVFGLVEPYDGEAATILMTVKMAKRTKTVSLPQHWDRDLNKKFW